MHLKADVFSCAKGSAHTTEYKANSLWGKAEARSHLLLIFVKPLSGDVDLNTTTISIRNSERGFGAQERLILHTNDVFAFDNNLT
jgi:hypothetical protein